MSEISNACRKGFGLWKRAKFTQMGVLLVLGFIGIFVVAPLGFLIAINAAEGQVGEININPDTLLIVTFLKQASVNPGFWLSILATVIVVGIIGTIVIGAIQKTAQDYKETDDGRLGGTIRALIPMTLPLAVVAIISGLMIAIPSWIVAEILNRLSDSNLPVILNFDLFFIPLSLTIMHVAAISVIIPIFILLGGPYFLAITAVVADRAGINGIVDGWRLYIHRLLTTVGVLAIVLIVGTLDILILLIPVNGIVLAADSLSQIFLNIFLLMLFIVVIPFFNNFIYTVMYSYYREIRK